MPKCLLKKRLLTLILLSLVTGLFLSCQTVPFQMKAPLTDEGVLFLYLKPFPQEASRLSFAIEKIQAVEESGVTRDLTISLKEFSGKEGSRQRLVAAGPLPAGAYTGFSLQLRKAGLRTEKGDVSLQVPETPVRLNYPFRLQRKRGLVLSMNLQYRESLRDNSGFIPSILLYAPDRPLTSLMGFVSDSILNTVMVFDKHAKEITGAIVAGDEPRGMALNRTRNRLFVALAGEDAVSVIDISTNEVQSEIRLLAGDKPNELALTPDERTLVVPNAGSDTVSIIDASNLIEITRINVGIEPRSVTIDKYGRRAFVCNTGSGTLSVIDMAAKAVIATIVVEPRPLRSRFNRNGDRLYIVSEASPYLLPLDPVSLSVRRREYVGMGMHFLMVDPRTDLVYLGKKFGSELAVYDPLTWVPTDYVRTKGPAESGAIDDVTNDLYVTMPENKAVSVISLTNRKQLTDLDIGGSPFWITLYGER